MADITLARNVAVDTESSTHSGHISLFLLRELYLLGYWQEMEKDSDTGWTSVSNVLAEPSDLIVAASAALEITSASTPFTQAMEGQFISLYASNNVNRGLYKIRKVLSTSKITIEPMCRPDAWVDETGISAKIHNAGKSDYLADSSYFVVRAPSATGRPLEVKVNCTASTIALTGYPLGDYFTPPGVPSTPGNRTATAQQSGTIATSVGSSYFNAYITDPAGAGLLFHAQIGSPNRWIRVASGELEDVATGDSYPGFINMSDSSEYPDSGTGSDLAMLDDTETPITAHPTYWATGSNSSAEADSPHRQEYSTRMKGKAPFWKPNVVMENSIAGGYVRGTLPYYACNPNNPTRFPIDPGYIHLRYGVVIPRSSSQDKTIRGLG